MKRKKIIYESQKSRFLLVCGGSRVAISSSRLILSSFGMNSACESCIIHSMFYEFHSSFLVRSKIPLRGWKLFLFFSRNISKMMGGGGIVHTALVPAFVCVGFTKGQDRTGHTLDPSTILLISSSGIKKVSSL